MSCTLSTRGIERRPPALPYQINGVVVGYLPAPSMLEHKMQKAPQVYLTASFLSISFSAHPRGSWFLRRTRLNVPDVFLGRVL
jgi:hypothetical protein